MQRATSSLTSVPKALRVGDATLNVKVNVAFCVGAKTIISKAFSRLDSGTLISIGAFCSGAKC